MKLGNLDFIKLLPHWMRDEEFNAALADAMTEVFGQIGRRTDTLRTWDQIDNLSSEELDELAWELNIDWWQSSWDVQTKREVVKTAQVIIDKRGTKWSVEQLVISAYGIGEVTEWFEDGGLPYHFTIRTNAPSTEEGMAILLSMIDKVKPARSYLDEVVFSGDLRTRVYAGVGLRSVTNNVIIDSRHETAEFTQPLITGITIKNHTKNVIS